MDNDVSVVVVGGGLVGLSLALFLSDHGVRPLVVEQLERFAIRHRVLCNRGGKGPPVAELIAEMKPSATVFVDDLAVHHQSVAHHAPEAWRLHMVAEPRLAAHTPPADHAHARIDEWDAALGWIEARLQAGSATA